MTASSKIKPGAKLLTIEEIDAYRKNTNTANAKAANRLTKEAEAYEEEAEKTKKNSHLYGMTTQQNEQADRKVYWANKIAENKRKEAQKIRAGEALPSYYDTWNDFISETKNATKQAKATAATKKITEQTQAQEEKQTQEIEKYANMGVSELLKYKKQIEESQQKLRNKAQLKEMDGNRVENTQAEISEGLKLLEKQLNIVNKALIQANNTQKVKEYEARTKTTDYTAISQAGKNIANDGIENVLTAVQNNEATPAGSVTIGNKATFARELKQAADREGIEAIWTDWQTMELEKYSYMTEDEVALYSAILLQDGVNEADKYYKAIEKDLDRRIRAKEEAQAAAYAEAHPVLAAAESVLLDIANMGNPLPITNVLLNGIKNMASEIPSEVDINSPIYRNTARIETLKATSLKDTSETGRFFANMGMSMAQNIGSHAIYGAASLYVMAGNAAVSTYYEAKKNGATEEQATGTALISGMAEYVFEKIEYNRLMDMWNNKAATYDGVVEYIKQYGVSEGIGESLTEVTDIIGNSIMLGKDSEWAQALTNYKMQGLSDSEAFTRTFLQFGWQIAEAGISGMLSGLIMSGGSSIINAEMSGSKMDNADSIDIALQVLTQGKDKNITAKAQEMLESKSAEVVTFKQLNDLAADAMKSQDAETRKLGEKLNEKLLAGAKAGRTNITRGDLIAFAQSANEEIRTTALLYAGIEQNSLETLINEAEDSTDSRMRQASRLLKKMVNGKGATAYEKGLNYLNATGLIDENAALIKASEEKQTENEQMQIVEQEIENNEQMKEKINSSEIHEDMRDEERSSIIKELKLKVTPYNGVLTSEELEDIENIKESFGTKAKKYLKEIGERLNIFKNYNNKNIDGKIVFSNKSLKESSQKQYARKGDVTDFVKMMSVFDELVENAQLIEVHSDKYVNTDREDRTLKKVYVLLSAYEDNGIIPVQIEVKEYTDKNNKLYMAVTLNKISADIKTRGLYESAEATSTDKLAVTGASDEANNSVSVISIRELIENINTKDENFLKYIPDDILNEKQMIAKRKALETENERIEKMRSFENDIESEKRETELKNKLYNIGKKQAAMEGDFYEQQKNETIKKMKKEYDTKLNKTQLKEMVDNFFKQAANDERSIDDLREIAYEIAEKIIESSETRNKEHDKEVKPIRDALKGRKLALNNEQIAEVENWYGSMAEFKKAIGNYITIRNEGESLDSVWQELAEMFPDTFDKETADVDMPAELEGIADYLRPRVLDNQFKFDEVREEVFNELYEACEKINDALIRDTSESTDIIVTAFNLHAGEITYAKKIAAGEADIKNINPQFDKTGVRRLAQYFAAHPEALEKYTDGTYDLAKIKAQTTVQAKYMLEAA